MGFFDRINEGLTRSRDRFKESMNVLLDRGPQLDEDFWENLEETLILSDIGGPASFDIVERLRDQATRKGLPDAYAVLDMLTDEMVATFAEGGEEVFSGDPALVLFVGINGTGKTTTVGKLAKKASDEGRTVILGSADTFRAAAIEQLEVWAQRAGVEMVTRERGADPASVCYETIERAEAIDADLVLIDTAGRLHTSADLMRELEKVVNVVRKRSSLPVYNVLVIDATTGQNGLQQAREFNKALDLDGVIVTKLDGTAKGGIALAISHELQLPILKIGVGESIEDLRDFDARRFIRSLIGDFDERDFEEEEEQIQVQQLLEEPELHGGASEDFDDAETAEEIEDELEDEVMPSSVDADYDDVILSPYLVAELEQEEEDEYADQFGPDVVYEDNEAGNAEQPVGDPELAPEENSSDETVQQEQPMGFGARLRKWLSE